MVRSRWAAMGAAVAVSLGAGGLGLARATAPAGAATYVPIVPCRLVDTRPETNVGPHSGPLVGPDAEITVAGWGDVAGDCDLPTGTAGLQLNVTAVGASQLTNLRFYPDGSETPTASNLNPAPGQPPTPNAVAVALDATNGNFHAFNRFGSVDLVIDVQGYYVDHDHDDRYYPRGEADAAVDAAVDAAIATRVPRQQTVFIPSAAFGARTKDDPIRRTSLLVYRESGGYLDAPVTLPVGSRILRIGLSYVDNSAADLTVSLTQAYVSGTVTSYDIASLSTSGASVAQRTVAVTPSEPVEVGVNQTFSLKAYSSGWTSALVIYAVRIDYLLPANPSELPTTPPVVTVPPISD